MKKVISYAVGIGILALVIIIGASAVPWKVIWETLGVDSSNLPSVPRLPPNLPWVWENAILLLLIMTALGATLLTWIFRKTKGIALLAPTTVFLWILAAPAVPIVFERFGLQMSMPSTSSRPTVLHVTGQELVRLGCDGRSWFIHDLPPYPVPLPNCSFGFDVLKGVLRLQGRDGREVDARPGQKIDWPEGFRVAAMRPLTSEISLGGTFCPFEKPYWNNGCTATKPRS